MHNTQQFLANTPRESDFSISVRQCFRGRFVQGQFCHKHSFTFKTPACQVLIDIGQG